MFLRLNFISYHGGLSSNYLVISTKQIRIFFFTRESMPHALRIVHPFDWTFTPEGYKGSIWSDTEEPKIRIEPTDQVPGRSRVESFIHYLGHHPRISLLYDPGPDPIIKFSG